MVALARQKEIPVGNRSDFPRDCGTIEAHMRAPLVLFALLVCTALTPAFAFGQDENSQSTPPAPIPAPIVYRNTQYGFCFRLPVDWKGYRIITSEWSGWSPNTGKMMHGSQLVIRNPAWTEDDPYQDIPIMVFTQAQWREKEKHGLITSAFGADWPPFGRNAGYVFKQPDRWIGYADVRGMKEVEDLMMTHPFQAPCGPIVYRNTEYGFCFLLPSDWKGYKVIAQKWEGAPADDTKGELIEGQEILLRNPNWTSDAVWQDIPIMIFSRAQWKLVQTGKYAFSAGPDKPGALGINSRYVFALPPRWLPTRPSEYSGIAGVEQVLWMMSRNPFRAPCSGTSRRGQTQP